MYYFTEVSYHQTSTLYPYPNSSWHGGGVFISCYWKMRFHSIWRTTGLCLPSTLDYQNQDCHVFWKISYLINFVSFHNNINHPSLSLFSAFLFSCNSSLRPSKRTDSEAIRRWESDRWWLWPSCNERKALWLSSRRLSALSYHASYHTSYHTLHHISYHTLHHITYHISYHTLHHISYHTPYHISYHSTTNQQPSNLPTNNKPTNQTTNSAIKYYTRYNAVTINKSRNHLFNQPTINSQTNEQLKTSTNEATQQTIYHSSNRHWNSKGGNDQTTTDRPSIDIWYFLTLGRRAHI